MEDGSEHDLPVGGVPDLGGGHHVLPPPTYDQVQGGPGGGAWVSQHGQRRTRACDVLIERDQTQWDLRCTRSENRWI